MDFTLCQGGNVAAAVNFIRDVVASTVNTCLPGEIVSFDKERQTAVVQSCTRKAMILDDGTRKTVDRPFLADVPVVFPYSTTTGFSMTYPVAKGDQCLLLFSQDALDSWQARGSVQDPPCTGLPRHFDYTDAVAVVGLIPRPSAIGDFQDDGIEIRNRDRSDFVKVLGDALKARHTEAGLEVGIDMDSSGLSLTVNNGSAGAVDISHGLAGQSQYVFRSGSVPVSLTINSTPGALAVALTTFVMSGIEGESVTLGGGSVTVTAPLKWGVTQAGQVRSVRFDALVGANVLTGKTKDLKLRKTDGGAVELIFTGGILTDAIELS